MEEYLRRPARPKTVDTPETVNKAGQLTTLWSCPNATEATPTAAKSHALSAMTVAARTNLSCENLTLLLQSDQVLARLVN